MFEAKAQGHVEPARSRKVVEGDTWTEVTVFGIHPAVVSKVRPARLQAYRAHELRGQLLERDPVVRGVAVEGEHHASAEVRVRIDDAGAGKRRTAGIPEPRPVSAPGEDWRSRLVDGRWEYNSEHRDCLAASETEARRLRYLVSLFAKEIVLQNLGGPGPGQVLERMVEVLTYLDEGARRGG